MTHIFKHRTLAWWIKGISCTMLFVGIITFAVMKMNFLLMGVKLQATIDNTGSSITHVKGNAFGANYITLNGRSIYMNKDGSFSEDVVLLPGLSVIKLDTEDQFGNTREKKFEVFHKDSGETFAVNDPHTNSIIR